MNKKIELGAKIVFFMFAAFILAAVTFAFIDLVTQKNITQPSISNKIVRINPTPKPSISESIVKISSVYGQGSGVIVERSDGYITILTAGHCLTDPDSIPVFTVIADNGFTVEIPVDSIYVDAAVDLAVCRVPVDESFAISAAPIGQEMDLGDAVTVVGYGLFGEKITTHCYVAVPPAKGELILDGTVNPGNSGCPVLNDNDEVVGIVFAKVAAWGFEGVGIAHSADICKNVLERYKILQGLE